MAIIEIILVVLMVVAAAVLTFAVLRQPSKGQGLSSAIGGGSSDTYYGQGKSKSKEAFWNKVTIVLSVFFVLVALAFFIIQPTKAKPDIGNPGDQFGIPEETTTVEVTTTVTPTTTTTPTTTVDPATTTTPTTTAADPSNNENPNG